MTRLSTFAVAGVLLLGGQAPGLAQTAAPHVYFVEPADGASVTSPFKVKFGLDNYALKPAGDASPESGHHHLIVDGAPPKMGEVIGAGETSLHFGKAQTETTLSLPPGHHKLTLQLGDGAHVSLGPQFSSTIEVEVR
ncbi:DUF4399 domain-containing protein [Methylocella sp.]|uniref:DUF4399 domain-containing protein n=1 Tax=Methylocella sp. TaxID=1978226 RepID=UPI0035B00B81